jgi:hypothetical protein
MAQSTRIKWGYLNRSGDLAIPFSFDHASQFGEGFAVVDVKGRKGFISTDGTMRISPQYGSETQPFFEGLALVEVKPGRCGYINKDNHFVIDPIYDWGGCFSEGIAFVRVADRYGYIGKNGAVIVEPQYECAGDFSCGFASVYDGEEWYYLDRNGKRVANLAGGSGFHEGVATVWLDDMHALLLTSGETIRLPGIEWVSEYCENERIQIRDRKGYGYVNKQGQVVIAARFDEASTFSEGLAAVQVNSSWGYIDVAGNIDIQPQFDKASFFHEGLAGVTLKGKDGFIDGNGKVVFMTTYKAGFPFREGLTPIYTE